MTSGPAAACCARLRALVSGFAPRQGLFQAVGVYGAGQSAQQRCHSIFPPPRREYDAGMSERRGKT